MTREEIDALLERAEADLAKHKAPDNARAPDVMHKAVISAFGRVDRRRRVDAGEVVIKTYAC